MTPLATGTASLIARALMYLGFQATKAVPTGLNYMLNIQRSLAEKFLQPFEEATCEAS